MMMSNTFVCVHTTQPSSESDKKSESDDQLHVVTEMHVLAVSFTARRLKVATYRCDAAV